MGHELGSHEYTISRPAKASTQADEPSPSSRLETADNMPFSTMLNRSLQHILEPTPLKITGGVVGGMAGVLITERTILALAFGVSTGVIIGWLVGSVLKEGWYAWQNLQTELHTRPSTPAPHDPGFGLRQLDPDRPKDNDTNWFADS